MLTNTIVPCRNKELAAMMRGKEGKRVDLKDIAIEVTEICFQSCRGCYGDFTAKGREMTLEAVEAVKEQFDRAAITTAHLTGGETLWHGQIEGIIQLFGEAGYKIEVDTNGVLIDKEMADLLNRFGVEVLVSLDSLDEETYSWYRGTNTLPQVLEGIDLMLKRGMTPGIQMVAADFKGRGGNYNPVENMMEVVEYATAKGVPVYMLKYRPMGRAEKVNNLVSDLNPEDKEKLRKRILALPDRQRELVSGDIPFQKNLDINPKTQICGCLGGLLYANMTVDGYVYVCNWTRDKKFGNVFNEDLSEIINKMRQFRFNSLESLESCQRESCDLRRSGVCYGPCLIANNINNKD